MLQVPVAPVLDDLGDPLAWHEPASVMAPNGMRRIRRIDVARGAGANAPLAIDAMFRDTHMDEGGAVDDRARVPTGRRGRTDGVHHHVHRRDARRVLPYRECPEAAASAQRVVGTTTAGLRARTRVEFVGVSTCTHLNDVLRALEDVEVFASYLDRGGAR